MTTIHTPGLATLRSAVDQSRHAPSVHNSQPWLWTTDGRLLRLRLDDLRTLRHADPEGRQAMISCGAALHHVRAALRAEGWETHVRPMPGGDPRILAEVTAAPLDRADPRAARIAAAIPLRRTDRRPYRPLEPRTLDDLAATLAAQAHELGVSSTLIDPGMHHLITEASGMVTAQHRYDADYQHDTHWWIGASTRDEGIPATALPRPGTSGAAGRDFQTERGTLPAASTTDEARVLVLATAEASPEAWLMAGQALSAVLLEATARGVATCTLTHMTEEPRPRELVHDAASRSGPTLARTQAAIRLGLASGPALPPVPRRRLEDLLELE
ncbi:hypothetical protein HT102_01695 [Hoyosella sp. G463]|uniref:NAD(P)H nitroreductase n=1 Tax=Lolliginicoccus lacisalsi TaxID=2742202 RepID=A0A927PK19_9ACTN|nr:hypothetical protein [Lolliginicoccus lacisalsi]MBD8505203.1 hypothetical protein [Lolliginicoccus lacisalsi]